MPTPSSSRIATHAAGLSSSEELPPRPPAPHCRSANAHTGTQTNLGQEAKAQSTLTLPFQFSLFYIDPQRYRSFSQRQGSRTQKFLRSDPRF